MVSSDSWLPRVAEALGPTGAPEPLGGSAWRLAAGGRLVVAKPGPGATDEADGLRRLAAAEGGPAVPDVLMCQDDLLVTAFVEQGPRTSAQEERLGRQLAALHRAPVEGWGGGSSFVGACRVEPSFHDDGASFYSARLLDLARRCGLEAPVAAVADRLDDLVAFGAPSLVHGDLWWGNVLWCPERPVLIDPSCHGGHPEEDLAMLALFGTLPERLLAAYREARPLDDGFAERVGLFQLPPLLVHAVLFGGAYRHRAEELALRYGQRAG